MVKPAIGKISVVAACEVKTGVHIPDRDGFIHEVTAAHCLREVIQLFLADGQVMNLRPATQLYCLDLFTK